MLYRGTLTKSAQHEAGRSASSTLVFPIRFISKRKAEMMFSVIFLLFLEPRHRPQEEAGPTSTGFLPYFRVDELRGCTEAHDQIPEQSSDLHKPPYNTGNKSKWHLRHQSCLKLCGVKESLCGSLISFISLFLVREQSLGASPHRNATKFSDSQSSLRITSP